MKRNIMMLGMLCAASATWATLVIDDFSRTVLDTSDTSALSSNAVGYATWKQDTAKNWQISGDYLHSHLNAPGLLYDDSLTMSSGGGDSFTFGMDVASKEPSAWAGVLFNYTDANNYYLIRFKSGSTSYQAAGYKNGVWTTLVNATAASNFTEDLFYRIEVTSDTSDRFDFTITEVGSGTGFGSASNRGGQGLTGGYAGAYANASGWATGFDNYSLEVIPEPATLGMVGLASGALLFIRRRFLI